ncbi:MAG: hypothetical protein R2800_05380 [Flavipsychrobacter sp.]
MQRINVLLNKLADLSRKAEKIDLIEVDLMLDYTKVLYADLTELRNKKVYTSNSTVAEKPKTEEQPKEAEAPHAPEPTVVQQIEDNDAAPLEEKEAPQTTEVADVAPTPLPVVNAPLPANKNIKKFIGINDKYQFISELFDNDTTAYDEVIGHINTFDTAAPALEWLEHEVSKERNWNEDSDSVKMFYDTVSNFFAAI